MKGSSYGNAVGANPISSAWWNVKTLREIRARLLPNTGRKITVNRAGLNPAALTNLNKNRR